jgi:hypothetical protein
MVPDDPLTAIVSVHRRTSIRKNPYLRAHPVRACPRTPGSANRIVLTQEIWLASLLRTGGADSAADNVPNGGARTLSRLDQPRASGRLLRMLA